jgi:hypothetical protein
VKHGRPKRVHAPKDETKHGKPSQGLFGSALQRGDRSPGPFVLGLVVLVGLVLAIGAATDRFGFGGGEPEIVVATSPTASRTAEPTSAPTSAAPSPTTPTSPSPTPSVEPSPSGEPAVSPSVEPSASPSPSPSGARGTLVLQGAGDVNLDPTFLPILRSKGFAWAWSGLGGVFGRDDLSFVNLECPATTIDAPVGSPNFRCSPEALTSMRAAGVDVVNQANEHVFDQGSAGLLDSLRRLRAAGFAAVGAGSNAASAIAPAILERDGWKIAVVGIGQVTAQPATSSSAGTAGQDFASALAGIRAAAEVADIVVVTIHWGVEGDTQPRAAQLEQAKQMVAAGADVIFGHHAHRLQPLRLVDGKPVFFSLGNLVWAAFSDGSTTTGIGRVTISPDGTIAAEILPARIASSAHPVLV